MIEIKKINSQELRGFVDYLLRNRNNVETIINDFGEIIKDNGHGTIFLKPKNPLLRVFWIYQQKGTVETIGLGGPYVDLTLEDIYSVYNKYEEGYSRFEDQYVYVFFISDHYTHTVKISSSDKLMDGKKIIKNINVNGFEISFK